MLFVYGPAHRRPVPTGLEGFGSQVSRNEVLQAVQLGNQAVKADILNLLRKQRVLA